MIEIQGRYFNLEIEYKQIKHLYLKIKGDTLVVSAPFFLKRKDIIAFIKQKEDAILKRVEAVEKHQRNSFLKIDDKIAFEGKWYKLILKKGKNQVQILEDTIIIYSKEATIDEALHLFYQKAETILKKNIEVWLPHYLKILNDYGYLQIPQIRFKMMKGSWGICYSQKNVITLNKRLIHFEKAAQEAVLWHELLHFILPNHTKRYHEVLEYHMPDYKRRHSTIY